MMMNGLTQLGPQRATAEFGNWSDRIAHGEIPTQAPPRPQGVERNVVITQWDWADPKAYLHDEISTDKRNPTSERQRPDLWIAGREPRCASGARSGAQQDQLGESSVSRRGYARPAEAARSVAVLGRRIDLGYHVTVHNPMFGNDGRLWFTSRLRGPDNPAWCKAGSSQPSAKITPVERSGRQLAVYDPKTKKVDLIDTCYATHHLLFAEDANNTLWTSSGGGGGVVGWLNTKVWDQTHDRGEGRRDGPRWCSIPTATASAIAYEEVDQNVATLANGESTGNSMALPRIATDPKKDTRLNAAFYGLAIGTDGSVWGSVLGFPGGIVRLDPGSNPSETALAEYYEVPWNNPKAKVEGFSPRGMDIDRNNVAWVVLASGHLASFDRSKCKGPLNGPKATGQHCPEGWTLYPSPGPNFKNVKSIGQCGFALLRLGGSVGHARPRQEYADRHRQRQRFAAGAAERQVGGDARSVSSGLFRQGHGRPHRRSQGRLEGQRRVDHVGHAHSVPFGNRKGDHGEGGALPDPAGSAGGLITGPVRGQRVQRASNERSSIVVCRERRPNESD